MKKFKLILVTAMIFALLIPSLAGCAQNGAPQSGNSGANSTTKNSDTDIYLFGPARSYPGQEEAYKKVIDAFTAETGINVHVTWKGKWDEIPQNLSAAKMSGERIDITYVTPTYLSDLAKSGVLLNMTDLMAKLNSRFAPNVTSAYTIGGKLWGFPFGSSGSSAIYYNVEMFKELGISEPATFDDLVAAGKRLTEKGIIPMIQQGKSASYWPMWFMETYAQTTKNTSVDKTQSFLSGKESFNSAETTAAFDKLKAFYDNGLLTSASLETDGDGMRATFAQKKAAMFYSGLWDYPTIKDMVKDFTIGVMEFPKVTDDANVKSQHGGGVDDGFGITSFANQDNLENIMKLIEYLTRPENANTIISTYSPLISTLKGVEVTNNDVVTKINDQFVPNTITFLDWIWPSEVTNAVANAVPAVMTGQMTSADAAQSVQDAYDTIVKEKQYQYNWWNSWTEADWAKVTPKSIPSVE